MARDFIKISDGIIKIIQEECTFYEEKTNYIIEQIRRIQRSSSYKAPEVQYISWCELAELLADNFCSSRSDWEEKIRKLFANEITLDEI